MLITFCKKIRKMIRTGPALIALTAAMLATLSIGHHALNFWGLGWKIDLLVLLGGLLLTLPIYYLLVHLWEDLKIITWKRWALFIPAGLIFSGILAWNFYVSPITWHTLQIKPLNSSLEIIEVKSPFQIEQFSWMSLPEGWQIKNGSLIVEDSVSSALTYSFQGPVNKPVSILFRKSSQAGNVEISLDGQTETVDLHDDISSLHSVEKKTRFYGLPGEVSTAAFFGIDLLTFFLAVLVAWLIQEVVQNRKTEMIESSTNHHNGIKKSGWFKQHRTPLIFLLVLAILLHTLNALAVPLVLNVDSPSYLMGAEHWLESFNLDGVSPQRGLGSTILFTPVLALWGRNPWGMKMLLHLFGLGCIPLAYAIGWKLGKQKWFAFTAGLFAVITPDLMFYANYVMSDLPNIFLVLLFTWLLLMALDTHHFGWQLAVLLTGSFAVLFRSENSAILAVGAGFIGLQLMQQKLQKIISWRQFLSQMLRFGAGCILALLPLLGWSLHNSRVNDFFGLTNYSGAVIYDGWIFFSMEKNQPILDEESPAVQTILAAYEHQAKLNPLKNLVFEGDTWNDFDILKMEGNTEKRVFDIMKQAALDSIFENPMQSLKFLAVKIKDGLRPVTTATMTFDLPGETPTTSPKKAAYFDEETLKIPFLIKVQRQIYNLLENAYNTIYPVWVWICISAMLMCLFRKPFYFWAPMWIITFLKVFFPLIISFGMWRYVVSGIILLEIFTLAAVQSLVAFIKIIILPQTNKLSNNRMHKPTA